MSHRALNNCLILMGQYNVSGDLNSVGIQRSQAALPDDTFGPNKSFMARIPGQSDGVFSFAGLVELTAGGQDSIFSANMSLANIPLTVVLQPNVSGRCKFGLIQQGEYRSGGNVGGRAEFGANGRIANYAMTDGDLLDSGTVHTGDFFVAPLERGPSLELGAVGATQKLYAIIHAIAKDTFTSAVFAVQSSATEGGSYTDRILFTTITGLTSQFAVPVAGPITDTWWRVAVASFTGTSLTVYAAVGIQ